MSANPYFDQAQKLQWQGRYGEAVAQYRRALQMEPHNGRIYYEMAISLTHLGMKAEAKEAVEKAKALDPAIAKEIEAQHARNEASKMLRALSEGVTMADAGAVLDAVRQGYISWTDAQQAVGRVDRSAAPQLWAALDDEGHSIRALAAGWISRCGDKKAIPKLVTMLNDAMETVRLAVVKALRDYCDASLIPTLQGVAQNDASKNVQAEAEKAVRILASGTVSRNNLWE
jgi:HEAT repeat protein